MCGIVGFYGEVSPKDEKAFCDMLIMDTVRGADSVGAAFITRTNQVSIVKDTVWPLELITSKPFAAGLSRVNAGLIGHNRSATRGTVSGKNAHPFTHGDITMVHNGTLNEQYRLPEGNLFDTDSEAICHSLDLIGIDDTWKTLNGAAALAFYNSYSRTFYLIRNKERPLWWAVLKGGKSIVYASEPGIARAALVRNGVELAKDTHFNLCEENMLYEFRYNAKKSRLAVGSRKLDPHEAGDWKRWEKNAEGKWVYQHAYRYIGPSTNTMSATINRCVDNWCDDEIPFDYRGYMEDPKSGGRAVTPVNNGISGTNVALLRSRRRSAFERAVNPPGFYKDVTSEEKIRADAFFKPGHKLMDENTFIRTYPLCSVCGKDMDDEYITSAIVGGQICLCGACADTYKHRSLLFGFTPENNIN